MVQDTALLDFINEVQMYYTGAQVSATALTSMTSQMRAGTIRKCDMASIYTYQNTLYKLQMTGEQLRRFMEWSAAFFKTWKPDEVTIAFDPSVRYYLYDAFEGVSYELDVSKEPGHRIKNLKWPNGKAVKDTDTFVVAVNNYRATTQLLTAADIFLPGEELPKLLEIDVRGDVGGIRELLGEYIRTVKGGTIEPHVNNNWKIVGNNWKAADHQKAVQLLREGKLALNENADARTLPGKAITTRISPSSKKQFPVKRGFPCWDGKPLFCVRNGRIQPFPGNWLKKQYHSAAFRGTMKLYWSRCCGQMGASGQTGRGKEARKNHAGNDHCSHCNSAGRRRHCRRAALRCGELSHSSPGVPPGQRRKKGGGCQRLHRHVRHIPGRGRSL